MAGLLLLCAGCATSPASPAASTAVRDFAAKGYAPGEPVAASTSLHTWRLSGQDLGITLTLPQRSGPLPLVIYLPGLGEAGSAGEPWRTAWAGAGYAVLSVQLLQDDLEAWKSDLARAGEFKALGRQRYATPAVAQRLLKLVEVVAQAQRRAAAGEPEWQAIDWRRVAVAGFDLGGYTAMVLAGEQPPGLEGTPRPLAIRAAIVLSPHATQPANSLDTRYADVRVPVLSVTSESDHDALGLVDLAQWREAPFASMPGPDKLLLQLHGLPHAALGGQDFSDNPRVLPAGEPQRQGGTEAGGPGRQGGGGGGGGGGRRQGTGDGARQARGTSSDGKPATATASAEAQVLRLVAAQRISTAFLDAHVKGDAAARVWLDAEAERWLGTAGTLRRK